MTKSPIILKDYRVNFINWHPDTLAEEKSIDGELQGHIMHFKLEFKGRVVILGIYYWTCEYKPGAWSPEEKWYFTDELEINFKEAPLAKMNEIILVHPEAHIKKIFSNIKCIYMNGHQTWLKNIFLKNCQV